MKGGAVASMLARAGQRNLLRSALLELTRRCNFRCSHCFNAAPLRAPELTTSQWKEIIEQLSAMGALFITFTGGEPLVRDDFLPIVSHARRHGFYVQIFSNGSLMDDRVVGELAQLRVGGVNISLYSGTSQVHDRITGVAGSHRAALAAMGRLHRRGVPVRANILVMDGNRTEWRGAVELAHRLGVDYQVDGTLLPPREEEVVGAARRAQAGVGLGEKVEVARANRERTGRSGGEGRPLVATPGGGEGGLSSLPLCGAGRSALHIGADGRAYPCLLFPEPAGDLLEQSLEELWHHSPLLQQMRALDRGSVTGCDGCELLGECPFCPALAFAEVGRPDAACRSVCERAWSRHLADCGPGNDSQDTEVPARTGARFCPPGCGGEGE